MDDYSLVPVDHQPDFDGVSLVPVEHDPFSPDDVDEQKQDPAATQPQPLTVPAGQPDVGAPPVGDRGQFSPGTEIGNKAADLAGKITYGLMRQFVTLPQRAIDASAQDVRRLREDGYVAQSIGPAVDSAMMMAGAGLPTAEREAVGAPGGKLPPLDSASSVADKLNRYLLDPDHVSGGPKAKWFEQALGFTRENVEDLAKQLVFDESRAV